MDGEGLKGSVARAFEPVGIRLRLDQVQLLRPVTAKVQRSEKFGQIAASIAEVGVIEPPVVVRHPRTPDTYLLLDGHLRIEALRLAGAEEVLCLVATDDEAFTYNKRISRLAAVQEHRMILRAIEKKVPEERLARALNIDVTTLRQKRRALDGVCPEAVEMLKGMEKIGLERSSAWNAQRVQQAMEAAGVEFIPENGGGPGVRLRKNRP